MISCINHPPRPVPEALWVGDQEWREPWDKAAVQPVWVRAGTKEQHPSGRWSVLTNPIDWERDRLVERGIVGGSGTSCPFPGHSLETSLWAGTLAQASLPRDGGLILKSLEQNKQVMGKVDRSCLCFWRQRTLCDVKGVSARGWDWKIIRTSIMLVWRRSSGPDTCTDRLLMVLKPQMALLLMDR